MSIRTRRLSASAALALSVLGSTAGCGQADDGASSGGTTSGPTVIEVTIEGDEVSPSGERVEVSLGQPIRLDVTADAPGEIGVHTAPEQELEYGAGKTTLTIDGIDIPGTVEVECHELDKVIVQLQVS